MLRLMANHSGKISLLNISRTFAFGFSEKIVQKGLSELAIQESVSAKALLNLFLLAILQNGEIDAEQFTFEKFYSLCLKICPRADIADTFNKL